MVHLNILVYTAPALQRLQQFLGSFSTCVLSWHPWRTKGRPSWKVRTGSQNIRYGGIKELKVLSLGMQAGKENIILSFNLELS
jgi:hypothetical protein